MSLRLVKAPCRRESMTLAYFDSTKGGIETRGKLLDNYYGVQLIGVGNANLLQDLKR
jgi:hypothetical protein